MAMKPRGEASVLSGTSKSAVMQSMNLELDEDQSHSTSFTSKNIFEKYIFPIVAEANRVKRVPNIVRLIEFFYIFVQVAFVGFDDVIPDTNIDNSYRIILNIVFFGFVGPADTHIPFFIALILIDFFTFLIFIGTIIDYHINHEYRKSLISILRIWHGHLFGIFLIPNILMIASSLSYLGSNFNAFGFLILIFSAIFGVYSIWHCLVLLNFFSRSPYLTPCPVQAWNIKNVYIIIVLFSIPIAIAKFLSFDFDDWFDFIPIILGLIVCIIGCIFCLYFPFKGVGYNALCYLALGNSIGSSIMMILLVGTDLDIPDLVFYGISIGVGIVLSIVMYFVLLNKQRKIVKQLNYASFWDNDEVKPTEDAKRQHFSTFNFSSPLTRLLYVQIGFEFMCDLSVDWALERYLSEQYPEDDALLVFMCWIVSLFPSEIHFLHNLITLEGKIPVRSLNEKCMIFQVHRIHIFRQSSASREASTDFAKVNQLTTNAINAFCKFWANVANPNVEFDEKIYTQLSNQQHQADAAWSEALDKYPNNSRFQNEYSRYLCDCCCAFKKSIIIHQHAAQLDSGAKLINDRNFHHFVLTFPNYLKKGVVDVRGNLKGPLTKIGVTQSAQVTVSSTTNSSSIGSASDLSNNDDDSSEHVDLEEGARYLPQVSLRLALERAIGDLRFPIISKIRIGSFARLFLTMAYIVIIIAILIPSFDSRKNLFDIFKQINYAEHNISLLSVQIPWFIYEGYKGGNVDYSHLIEELGDQSSTIESVVNLSAPIKAGIIKLAQDALLSMNNLGSLIYHVNFEEMISLQDFSVSYLQEKTPIYSCANYNHETTPFKLQDTINLDYMIRTFVTQSRILSRDSYEARAEYGISSLDFCEFYNNQVLVSDAFKSISGTVSVSVHMLFQHGDEEDDGEEHAKLLDSKLLNLSQSNNTFTNYSLSQSSKYNSKSQKILSKMSKLLDSDEENSDPEEGEEEEEEETESLDSLCDFFIAFSPFVLFAFILPSITFLSAGLTDEMNNFSKVLRTVPRNDCLKASERILKVQNSIAGKEKAKNYVTADKTNMANIPVWFFNLISAVVIIILVIVLAIYTKSVKVTLDEFCELFVLFTLKRNFIYDIGRELLYIHLINELGNQSFNSYFNISDNEARFNKYMKEYVMVSKVINLETDEFPSAIAIDSELSAIRFNSICDTPISSDRPANFYECISLDRAISYYIQLVNSVHATADKTSLLDSYCPYITHLLDTRMSTGYLRIFNRIESVYASTLYSFNVLIIVVTIVSIIFVLFEFFIEFIMLKTIQTQINTFKSLLLRVNPIAFVSNQNLLSLVYGKSKANDSHIISASHAVFMTSHDAMISLNDECIIESINPAATTIFGYTPEQMLGQNLKMLISPEYESNSQIYYNMQLMQSGQASLIFESDIIGKKDDENFVPLKVTLLGFSSNDKMAESFGLMCKDQTLETKQKNLVEEAKKQSENLLLQILPKDIIMRLNRGDTDISFTVPSATIVFIDIEKFSSYSASLSASEIMQNLGMVFTSYDKILHKFPLLIKIKLIGDDYMGAAGLFNPDSDPKEHAQQVVQFSLECLDAIEDLNEHLNASLQVRIGVNTNGPLIAGVLGTDKPLFDIIGDPINVAARLQSTDIPGCVQISQGTYDCVADSQFKIESRGEIELKGKGKQMTYLVYPSMRVNQSNASFSIGSTSSLPSEL